MDKSLSNQDIENFLGHSPNIIRYKDLKKFNSIDQALKNGYVIILYETKQNFGHWVLVFKRNKNTIEHFDSYGIKPDDELDFIKPIFKIINGTVKPYLTYLLLKSKYKVEYNEFKLQKMAPNINTCGRWILLRLLLKDYDIYDFKKILDKKLKEYKINNYDELVVKLIDI